MSWLATVLAGLLTVTAPVARTLAAGASRAPAPDEIAAGDATTDATAETPDGRVVTVARAGAPWQRLVTGAGEHLLVHARPGLIARRNPWTSAPVVGGVASTSKYYGVPLVLWVEEVSRTGRWGLVELPFVSPRREGWIPLGSLEPATTSIHVDVDLSEHMVRVFERGTLLLKAPGATGAPTSPTPAGDYVVTDRVSLSAGGPFGSFAFGISGVQPNLPRGWSGGNQLAIHGTNDPGTIGQSVSAGCVRVSESTLERLQPLLRVGTPVVIHP